MKYGHVDSEVNIRSSYIAYFTVTQKRQHHSSDQDWHLAGPTPSVDLLVLAENAKQCLPRPMTRSTDTCRSSSILFESSKHTKAPYVELPVKRWWPSFGSFSRGIQECDYDSAPVSIKRPSTGALAMTPALIVPGLRDVNDNDVTSS